MKNILYAAAECTPFIKTGGLGDVVGSLPKYLNRQEYDVRIVLPGYECLGKQWKKKMNKEFSFGLRMGSREKIVTVFSLKHDGVLCYFIGCPDYFGGEKPYEDMQRDIEKFSFFSKAVIEMLTYLSFVPDIIHCHDWQTGLIPVFLKRIYGIDPIFGQIKTIMTIHNLKFQGMTDLNRMKEITGLLEDIFTYDKLESYNCGNLLKGGLAFSDKITTVSNTYALEIQEQEYGEGLNELLHYRAHDLTGIVNGIDYAVYDPATDPYVEYHYDAAAYKRGKKNNKASLQKKVGLPQDKNAFVIGIVARLTDQKGFDLLGNIMNRLMKLNISLVVLGSGEKRYEDLFYYYKEKYPSHIAVDFEYKDELAKMIYAGCDAVLMPSRFEPCGLSQLMALRYGTVPIVRRTGGLRDTIKIYDKEKQTGTGFGFEGYEFEELYKAIKEAYQIFDEDKTSWNAIIKRGMRENFSWKKSSREYEKLYQDMTKE